jgi:hypothetical protein
MTTDLFGYAPPVEPFTDIRNQRESVAEEKARLCLELNAMCKKAPRFLSTASIQTVRGWAATHKQAMKTLGNKQASRAELTTAIESMRAWMPPEAA